MKPASPAETAYPAPSRTAVPTDLPLSGLPSLTLPQPSAADRGADIAALERVDEARRLIARGEVLEARAVLEATLAAVPAAALHELGRTFDPYYLGLLPRINSGSEPRRAAELYNEAIVHGSLTAGYDLDRLRALSPSRR